MPMSDWGMASAVETSSLFNLYSWAQFGLVPPGKSERAMRICPLCGGTVPNDSQVMRRHVNYHQQAGQATSEGVVNG